MQKTTPKIIYLGNIATVAEALLDSLQWSLAGCIADDDEDADELFRCMRPRGIPVHRVSNNPQIRTLLADMGSVDLGLIANFGIILSRETLGLTRFGFVNAHLGLLPENPGRHPIRRSIRRQDAITGVTLHRVTENVDQGPIIDRVQIPVGINPRGRVLFDRMADWIPTLVERNFRKLCAQGVF